MQAFEEVQPAFGVSEEELQTVVQNGIYHFDDNIRVSAQTITREQSTVFICFYLVHIGRWGTFC